MIPYGHHASASLLPFTPAWLKAPCSGDSWTWWIHLQVPNTQLLGRGTWRRSQLSVTAQSRTWWPYVSYTPSPTWSVQTLLALRHSLHCPLGSQRSSQNHQGQSGWGLEFCPWCVHYRGHFHLQLVHKLSEGGLDQPWGLAGWWGRVLSWEVIVLGTEQGSHTVDQEGLCSSLSPLSHKLPLHLRLTPPPPGLLSK